MLLGHIDTHQPDLPIAIQRALAFVREQDFSGLEDGRYPIEGEKMFALVQSPLSQPWDTGLAEFHQRYTDLQLVLDGEEWIGYHPPLNEPKLENDFLDERDIAFVLPPIKETRLILTSGMYAVFYPGELHRPCRASEAGRLIKKLVIKIDLK